MISPVLSALALTTCLQSQVVTPPAQAPVTAPAPTTQPQAPVAAPPSGPPPVTNTPPTPTPTSTSPQPAAPVVTPEGPSPVSEVPYAVFSDAIPIARAPVPPPPRKSRLVFAAIPSLVFGINAEFIPSVNGAFYFGGRLRNDKWSLGYQLTGSVGFADRYWLGITAHRHHLTALTHFGKRGFATIGGGIAFLLLYPAVAEIETKIGARLGRHKRFVIGGLVRLGINFYYREKAPLPQFGLFLGVDLF